MSSVLVDFSNQLADVIDRAARSVVGIKEGGRHGVSGTVWRPGVVVTAEHTIRGRQSITVVLPTGETEKAEVAGRDPGTDIAALKFAGADAAPAEFADSAPLRVGHYVFALGRRSGEGVAATYGIISAIGGPWRTWQGGRVDRYLRLDLLPYPGFSGGPLIDVRGQVLGINTSGPRRTILTIPSSTVDRVVNQLLAKGRVARGYFGAGFQPVPLSPSLQQALEQKRELGLLIVTLAPGGPAENAGLLVGDIVVEINGSPVADISELQAALDPEQVGKTARVHVLRGGKLTEIGVTISEKQ